MKKFLIQNNVYHYSCGKKCITKWDIDDYRNPIVHCTTRMGVVKIEAQMNYSIIITYSFISQGGNG